MFLKNHFTLLLVLSAILYTVGSSAAFVFFALLDKATGVPLTGIVHNFFSCLLLNIISGLLQLVALLLVSSRQTEFIQAASRSHTVKTAQSLQNRLREYEYIRLGVGPLYAVAFSIHAPIILCFVYFLLTNFNVIASCLWSCSNLVWSWLTLVHICLMAEDCYNVIQDVMPAIR